MDEPLSNLDAKLRVQTRAELVELQHRLQATVIYVTHDQVEAMTMGDRIAIMNDGVLQQVGPPQEVYERPTNLFVARFIGTPPMNTIPGALAGAGSDTVIGVRPEHLHLGATTNDGIDATVAVIESLGHERHVICRLADSTMVIVRQATEVVPPAMGDSVRLRYEAAHSHRFDATTEQRVG